MERTLLRGGRIINGTGKRAFNGHVLIEGSNIKAVLDEQEALPTADRVIDVDGYTVSPGFINVHCHSDCLLPLNYHEKLLSCLLEQGITTIVGGNCGVSPAPVSDETIQLMNDIVWIGRPLKYEWRSMSEFLDKIKDKKPVLNLAQLVGHTTARVSTVGMKLGALAPDELDVCLDKVKRSLNEGACGLSFGLGYDPARSAPNIEIERFAKIAAQAGKPVAVHLKAYSKKSAEYPSGTQPHILRALAEMIDIARRTGVSLQVSHFMLIFKKTWPLIEDCIVMIERARKAGIDIMMDAFPYTYG